MNDFKSYGHLFRLAGVFLVAGLGFVTLRAYLVSKSFGQYGHYRGDAMVEIAARPLHYAGHKACETCHGDVLETKRSGKHARVNCEACHGPLAQHADDPASLQPAKLDVAVLCVRCHEANIAKPRDFPQIASVDHSSGLPCDTCHQPHSPAIAGARK